MNINRLIFIIICIVFFFTCLFSLLYGSTPLTISDFKSNNAFAIFWELRLPRTMTAITCGGLLALAGVMMQLLLQNPLADPYVLGISSGAALLTLLMILLGVGEGAYIFGAWSGSLLTIAVLLLFAHKHRFHAHSLLLIGVAMASGYTALISFILLLSNNATLHTMLFWLTGDLNSASYPWFGLILLVIAFIITIIISPGLNLLLRGEREAFALGLPVNRYKFLLFGLSALLTAEAVTLAGCIGFIGLIIPHLTRQLVGHEHRVLIPAAILLGGSLLMTADVFARTMFAPEQLPVGIFMTFIGAPIFIWLLQK